MWIDYLGDFYRYLKMHLLFGLPNVFRTLVEEPCMTGEEKSLTTIEGGETTLWKHNI